jgi:hypothetical protein
MTNQEVKIILRADTSDAIAKIGLAEDSFKSLGIKSAGAFNEMRNDALRAFKSIQYSATSTANDIIRAEQAKNSTLRKINEEQYGHHATLIESMKKNWIAASAAVVAAYMAMNRAWNLADQAAKFEQQKVAFGNLAASYGSNADKIISSLKSISTGTISTQVLIEKAGTAMMMGINPDKISKLMEIARATSKMTGQSVTEAFDNISLAVGRQSKMILDNLGIIVSAGDANEKYAQSIGKTALTLTDAEKKTAFLNATISAGEDLMRRMGNQTDTARDKMDRFRAQTEDLKIALGQGLIRAGLGVMGVFQGIASGALVIASALFKVLQLAAYMKSLLPGETGKAGARDAA